MSRREERGHDEFTGMLGALFPALQRYFTMGWQESMLGTRARPARRATSRMKE